MQRTILDVLPSPTWIKDPEGRYLMVNQALADMLGVEASALEGRSDREVWGDELAAVFRPQEEAVAAGRSGTFVVSLPTIAGAPRQFEVVRHAVRSADGALVGYAGHARDVTDRLRLEEQARRQQERLEEMVRERTRELEEANQRLRAEAEERARTEQSLLHAQKQEALGRLAGGVVHDVNNLLAVVKSCADALHLGVPPEESGALAFEIAEAARRGTALTRQLLTFARRVPVEPRVVEVGPLAEGMAGMLRRLIPADVRIRTDLAAAPLRVLADPGQLEQVIMNLVVNARDAMPGGGEVTLSARLADPGEPEVAASASGRACHVVIAVADQGVGMTPEVQARIFEPFFTTNEPGKGTGLGLSTVFGIARQAGGFVTVQSAPGKGSTFRVWLPAVR
jgi:PAS domain S-box-containing protein